PDDLLQRRAPATSGSAVPLQPAPRWDPAAGRVGDGGPLNGVLHVPEREVEALSAQRQWRNHGLVGLSHQTPLASARYRAGVECVSSDEPTRQSSVARRSIASAG